MPNIFDNKLVAQMILWALLIMRRFLNAVRRVLSFDYWNKRKYLFLAITIAYAAMIFYLSSRSDIQIPSHIFKVPLLYAIRDLFENAGIYFVTDLVKYSYAHKDKVAHMFLYFGLGVFLHLTFRSSGNSILRKYAAPFAFIIGTFYGVSDEIHQAFVPGRSSSIYDLLADSIGIFLAQILFLTLIIWGLKERKKRKHQD